MEIDKLIESEAVLAGKWWLGDDRRRQYAGTIKFGKQITLNISGSNWLDSEKFQYPEVRGVTSDGEHIVLLNCFVSGTSSQMGRKSSWSMSLQPSDILLFAKNSDARWKTTTVKFFESHIPYFDLWLDDKLFVHDIKNHTIKYEERKERDFDLDGIKLSFNSHLSGVFSRGHNTRHEMNLKEMGNLRLEYPNEVEYTEALKLYRRLEGFFRLAYASQFFVKSFSGFFIREVTSRGKMRPYFESKDIYQNRMVEKKITTPPGLIDDLFLFNFKALDDPETIIKRWLEIEPSLAPVYQLLFSSLESDIYMEQRFLSLVNALEIFHRRFRNHPRNPENEWEDQKTRILDGWHGGDRQLVKRWLKYANEVSLQERLTDLVGGVNNTGFRGLMPETIKNIADTRNNFIHEEFGVTKENLDLAVTNNALTEILLISILQELGFSREKIHTLIRNRWIFRYSNGMGFGL